MSAHCSTHDVKAPVSFSSTSLMNGTNRRTRRQLYIAITNLSTLRISGTMRLLAVNVEPFDGAGKAPKTTVVEDAVESREASAARFNSELYTESSNGAARIHLLDERRARRVELQRAANGAGIVPLEDAVQFVDEDLR